MSAALRERVGYLSRRNGLWSGNDWRDLANLPPIEMKPSDQLCAGATGLSAFELAFTLTCYLQNRSGHRACRG